MATIQEKRISGATFFHKFVYPVFFVGFCLTWTILVAFVGTKKGPPSPLLACFGLVVMAGGLRYFIPYHFPLKQVWLGEHGLRISNFRDEVIVPYDAVESVDQMTQINLRYVVVSLTTDTIFGNRFTFVPEQPRMPWPFSSGEDKGVIDLRNRIKAAGGFGVGEKMPATSVRPARSVMADDELDGPL